MHIDFKTNTDGIGKVVIFMYVLCSCSGKSTALQGLPLFMFHNH